MNIKELLSNLKERGIDIYVEDGKIKTKAPPGVMDSDLLEKLRKRKTEILNHYDPPKTSSDSSPSVRKPFKVFNDFPDGRVVVFETEEDWDFMVRYFYQLYLWDQALRKKKACHVREVSGRLNQRANWT